jgi:hypothetical protein
VRGTRLPSVTKTKVTVEVAESVLGLGAYEKNSKRFWLGFMVNINEPHVHLFPFICFTSAAYRNLDRADVSYVAQRAVCSSDVGNFPLSSRARDLA